jgi:hypothetical protein
MWNLCERGIKENSIILALELLRIQIPLTEMGKTV